MASFASLSREERLGLGIAAVAHVALVAALVWQVRDDPTPLPIPERMDVSLADEVSLESTAPDPSEASAAVAPVIAPEPAPAPEPVPTVVVREEVRPVPRQTRAAVARPTPTPTPAATKRPVTRPTTGPTPRPTQSRAAGGSRIGSDFLEGAGASERSDSRGTPAATFGAAEQASLEQAINRQLKPHWNAPQGVDAEQLVTVLTWELNSDGTLKGTPRVVSQSGVNDSNRPQAPLHAERAIRAVQLAAPFELPSQYYDKWKRIRTWRFDRRL
jgi:outer membrane biosynthesis protein TonB